jgi:hypothetical protein
MKFPLSRGAAGVLAALAVTTAAAQGIAPPHPADPAAAVPAPAYRSAFEGYRPLRDEAPVAWRGANDEVARIGGHLGLFGGAQTPAQPAPGGAKPAPASPHGHHGGAR